MMSLQRINYPGECLDIVGQLVGPVPRPAEKKMVFFLIVDAVLGCDGDLGVVTRAYLEEIDANVMSTVPGDAKQIYSMIRADSIKEERGVDIRDLARWQLPPAFRREESLAELIGSSV